MIMGILNITPDSFSDGGRLYDGRPLLDIVLRRAESMLAEGADILDIGGESTRPGAAPVSASEEADRVLPVVQALSDRLDCRISVDTSTPSLMSEVIRLGAWMINDIRALQRPGALEAVRDAEVSICLMHTPAEPGVMQSKAEYGDVVAEVEQFLGQRVAACEEAGIRRDRLWLDPGFGFGKNLPQNLQLLRRLPELGKSGLPLLVGLSRKRMLGEITGREVADRLPGSLALALIALQQRARILRVHDVAATLDVVKIWQAIQSNSQELREA